MSSSISVCVCERLISWKPKLAVFLFGIFGHFPPEESELIFLAPSGKNITVKGLSYPSLEGTWWLSGLLTDWDIAGITHILRRRLLTIFDTHSHVIHTCPCKARGGKSESPISLRRKRYFSEDALGENMRCHSVLSTHRQHLFSLTSSNTKAV